MAPKRGAFGGGSARARPLSRGRAMRSVFPRRNRVRRVTVPDRSWLRRKPKPAPLRCSKTVPELQISAPERLAGEAEADVPAAVERLEMLGKRAEPGRTTLNSHAGGPQFESGRAHQYNQQFTKEELSRR